MRGNGNIAGLTTLGLANPKHHGQGYKKSQHQKMFKMQTEPQLIYKHTSTFTIQGGLAI